MKKQKTDIPPLDTASPDVYYPGLPQFDTSPSPSPGASFSTVPDEEFPEVADSNFSTTQDGEIPQVAESSLSTTRTEEMPEVEQEKDDPNFDPWGGFDEFGKRKWTEAPMSWKRATFPRRYPSSQAPELETVPKAQMEVEGNS